MSDGLDLHKISDREKQWIREFQRSLPEKPVNIVGLAKKFGLKVFKAEMPERISGMIFRESDGEYAIYANRDEPLTRRRFTYAHELAHFLLHKDTIGRGVSDSALYRSHLSDDKEVEANRLAADILMPADAVSKALDAGKKSVSEIGEIFGVSRTAIYVRLGIPF